MKKIFGIIPMLVTCLLLSSCDFYDRIDFIEEHENLNNENGFINYFYGVKRSDKDVCYIAAITLEITEFEGTDILVSLPTKIYSTELEKELTISALGVDAGSVDLRYSSVRLNFISFNPLDKEETYHITIDLQGMDRVDEALESISVKGEPYFDYQFTVEYINQGELFPNFGGPYLT